MNLETILGLIQDDRHAADQEIRQRLSSDVALINQLGGYIINSGGKRLRPVIVLLASRACGYQGPDHIRLAAIIEFIHTATLLHDDVVDGSELRRGQSTANAVWGNEASVLVGDFLYSRAFEMMVTLHNMRVMEILSKATNTIAEGEVMQLLNCHDPDLSEAQYLHVIRSKTAKLFEAAAQLGAVIGGQGPEVEMAMASYGMHLGTAFQLIDDVLDYRADRATLGKNIGDDLAEGKPTLPLIHAMQSGTPEQAAVVRRAIENGGLDELPAVLAAIRDSGALDYARKQAQQEAESACRAIANLPHSNYRDSLIKLADFAVTRNH